jgi:hypothetical protein
MELVAGSTRTTEVVLGTLTQTVLESAVTDLGPKASGSAPRASLATILSVRGSIRTTEPLGASVVPQVFVTQTASGVTTIPSGPVLNCVGDPSGMVVVTRLASGSIRTTLLDIPSVAHTEPWPKASRVGPHRKSGSPSAIVATTAFVAGSIRVTVRGFMFATQTAPPPMTRPPTAGTGIEATSFPAEGTLVRRPERQRNQ